MRGATSMFSRAPLLTRFLTLWKPKNFETLRRINTQAAKFQNPEPSIENEFYSSRYTSFASLGLDSKVTMALERAGFDRVADVQALAIPSILEGSDVVLAAETGSGKTLAYLAPIASRLLSYRDQNSDEGLFRDSIDQQSAIVLCPNMALCQQVAAVAQQCFSEQLSVSVLSASSNLSSTVPDIVISTPGALVTFLDGAGPVWGEEWTRSGLGSWARCVVFDEADMLLSGSYSKHINIIFDALRSSDRQRSASRMCAELGMTMEDYWQLPSHVRKQFAKRPLASAALKTEIAAKYGNGQVAEKNLADHDLLTLWLRQYIFVAATMPPSGDAGRSVGNDIAKEFPEAVWITGKQLHKLRRSVTYNWHQHGDTPQERALALVKVLKGDKELQNGGGKILVFVKDVASANETARILIDSHHNGESMVPEDSILLYHSGVPLKQRAEVLTRLRNDEGSGLIMICTDAASRGIDLPDVSHVIQADFAPSAIDFVHRVGRTGRAGRSGTVTSLYCQGDTPLVDAIRDAVLSGRPVEGAFSRKRSFKKKFKRYGTYVPRGEGVS